VRGLEGAELTLELFDATFGGFEFDALDDQVFEKLVAVGEHGAESVDERRCCLEVVLFPDLVLEGVSEG
jgi:hypothetical protein